MIVRTYRSKHFICMSVLLLSFTAAYSPVISSQEAQTETGSRCTSSDATPACPSTGPMKKIDKKETYRKPGNTKPAGGQPPYQPA